MIDRRVETVDIDVLIPVYNAASTIESALGSICRQTCQRLRIIVVDDGSTDASAAILRRMADADQRISIITTANRGIVDALNTALVASRAPLIARFDADDLAFPDRLQRQFDYLAAHPDCVAVGCNTFHIDGAGKRLGTVTDFTEAVVGNPFHAPCIEPYLLHPFLLARRESLVAVGGYRYVFHSEDADLYWRLSDVGRLANVEALLGEYRIHSASISAKSVVNGRISAISSQLAALSERRRRAGRQDIEFRRDALERYRGAETLDAMLDIASSGLCSDERSYLAVATAAKLMELTSFRPYSLERSDLVTIRRSVEAHSHAVSRENRRQIVFRQMIRPGRYRSWKELRVIVPWKILPSVGWDLIRDRLLHLAGRIAADRP